MSTSDILTMPTAPAAHPSDDALELYSLGRLRPSEAAAIEEHILICAECRQRLKDSDEYVAAMRQALTELEQEQEEPGARRSRFAALARIRKPVWVGAMAAVVLLALLVLPGQHQRRNFTDLYLTTYRGDAASLHARAPAAAPLSLHIDVSGLPVLASYRVEIVDAVGKPVYATEATPTGGKLAVRFTAGLAPGQYWVRVSRRAAGAKGGGELLREFSLLVK